jgi:hypothetical protein
VEEVKYGWLITYSLTGAIVAAPFIADGFYSSPINGDAAKSLMVM